MNCELWGRYSPNWKWTLVKVIKSAKVGKCKYKTIASYTVICALYGYNQFSLFSPLTTTPSVDLWFQWFSFWWCSVASTEYTRFDDEIQRDRYMFDCATVAGFLVFILSPLTIYPFIYLSIYLSISRSLILFPLFVIWKTIPMKRKPYKL